MRKHSLIIPCLISMVFYSCSDQNEVQLGSGKNSHVYFAVDDFIPENQTRTNCDPNNNYKITWASGDAIGIFPREGDQEPFVIPVEQVGQSKAAFDGGYWALKAGKTYNAYYPFSRENYASSDMKTKIPVTYLGQYQNGRECNVGAYDYTYSDWKESVGGAAVSFSFHHLGSFLVLKLPIPANATYTSLTLSAGNAVIPTTGTYDLTATTPAFISKTKASSLSMQLNSFTGVAGENATFYMMVPPMDLSAETMTVSLSTGSTSCSYSIESRNILAAKLYTLEGTPKYSSIYGTIDEWLPEDHEYVDLGLPSGTLWATCNVGASSPEGYGAYYAWGELEEKSSYSWDNYKWGTYGNMTKYCTDSHQGSVDNITTLQADDDVAYQEWGDGWCMPTFDQLKELKTKCTWTWKQINNVYGYEIKGENNNTIFLPAAGQKYGNSGSNNDNSDGLYLSSSLGNAGSNYCNVIQFFNPSTQVGQQYGGVTEGTGYDRSNGSSVRPVRANRLANMHNGHEYVDLGLPSGLKWATCNIGANTPEEYGDYFAWGETEPKTDFDWDTYKWCNGSSTTLTKYCTSTAYGTVDNKTVLEPEDDAAHVNWGGNWRMPTRTEQEELEKNCTYFKVSLGGKNCFKVVGPNGNFIYLTTSGIFFDDGLRGEGNGFFWSSSLDTRIYCIYQAYQSGITDRAFDWGSAERYEGSPIRPVTE